MVIGRFFTPILRDCSRTVTQKTEFCHLFDAEPDLEQKIPFTRFLVLCTNTGIRYIKSSSSLRASPASPSDWAFLKISSAVIVYNFVKKNPI